MSKCFAPGCKSGYLSTTTKNKELGKRNPSLFSAPKDKTLLEKWRIAVLRKDRIISHTNKICELHFTPDCLIKSSVTHLSNGDIAQIDWEKPRLKAGSIPTIFPNLPSWCTKSTFEGKTLCPRSSKNSIKQNSPCAQSIFPEKECGFTIFTKNLDQVQHPNSSWTIAPCEEFIDPIKSKSPFAESIFPEEESGFTIISKNLDLLQRLNLPWTIDSCREFIICAKWDSTYCPEKKIVIFQDSSVKIFLKNKEISMDVKPVCSIESLAVLLQTVDQVTICQGIGESSICMGSVNGLSVTNSRLCNICSIRKRQIRNQNGKKLQFATSKKLTLAQVKSNIRENARLKNEILKLKGELERYRKNYAEIKKIIF